MALQNERRSFLQGSVARVKNILSFGNGLFVGLAKHVAGADMHASGSQMAWIAAAPALGYIFATIWARQMEGKSKLPFVYWTWLAARGMFLLAPLIQSRGQYVLLVCMAPIVFSISTP